MMKAAKPSAMSSGLFHQMSLRMVAPNERGGGNVTSAELIKKREKTQGVHSATNFPIK
jgi:hypothetical protein